MTDSDPLFDDVELDGASLGNRVGLAPMTRTSATADGRATEGMARYYGKFADGGFSFLITEGTYPDTAHSQGYDDQPGLATDEQVESWAAVTERVHRSGASIFAQLMHAGALSQGNAHTDETIGPSAITPKGEQLPIYGGEGEFDTPRAATPGDIEAVIEGFVDAATNAVEADFDGVEIHGANGYLLDQFLTDYTNERDDAYGGPVENRVRLTAEVIEAVAEAVPEEFTVGVRISQTKVNDDEHEWAGGEAAAETIFGSLVDAGVDYVHVTEPDITAPAFEGGDRTFAEVAADYADVPVIANGGLADPDAAREAIERGVDLLTLATGALANPDWPDRVAADEPIDDFDFEATLLPDATIDDHEIPEPADD